jgi:hypothetical protein
MSEALQIVEPDVQKILFSVARKLEHATGIDEEKLDEMKQTALETFLQIKEILDISTSDSKTSNPVWEMYHLAVRINSFEPAIIARREGIAPLLKTLTEMSDGLPG